jgi:AcrR family transcriptional regulator
LLKKTAKYKNERTARRPDAADARVPRGPQPAYSRDQIAATAVKIADAEGLEAVSMRRIAGELGSGTASLYRYITKKDELLDLMSEAVLEVERLPRASGNWRADLRKIAYHIRAMTLRHPWTIGISTYRSGMGPNTLRCLELTLSAIDDLGLNIDEMLVIENTLFTFARGYAAGEIAEAEASRRSGQNREQWMRSRAEHTRAILATGKYPMFTRVVKDARAPHDPDAAEHGFAQGLEHFLNGIEARVMGSQIGGSQGMGSQGIEGKIGAGGGVRKHRTTH